MEVVHPRTQTRGIVYLEGREMEMRVLPQEKLQFDYKLGVDDGAQHWFDEIGQLKNECKVKFLCCMERALTNWNPAFIDKLEPGTLEFSMFHRFSTPDDEKFNVCSGKINQLMEQIFKRHKTVLQEIFRDVQDFAKTACSLKVAEICKAGSFGKGTLTPESDVDMVLACKDIPLKSDEAGFAKTLKTLEEDVERCLKVEVKRRTKHAVTFSLHGKDVDLLPVPNEVWLQSQANGAGYGNTAPVAKQQVDNFLAICRQLQHLQHFRKIIQLCKMWIEIKWKKLSAGTEAALEVPKPRSCLIEHVAIKVALKNNPDSVKSDKLLLLIFEFLSNGSNLSPFPDPNHDPNRDDSNDLADNLKPRLQEVCQIFEVARRHPVALIMEPLESYMTQQIPKL